tara:strand:+ start:2014 stop:4719 length:2706 start_codon:yes stop_codon:yes gene_type:complete
MAFNLKEYIIYRNEVKRELFNGEVDENFKAVANPWVDNRSYDTGHIVYHPVEVVEATGSTSIVSETLVWWRANKRTTEGVFVTAEWDIIGGIGTGDVSVGSANSFGKIIVNYTGVTPSLAAANDFELSSSIATDTFRLIAGAGVQLQYDNSVNAIKLINTSAGGEINQGVNIGIAGQDVFAGMTGTTLTFRSVDASNTDSSLGNALAVGLNIPNKAVTYNFNSSLIDLATLNNNNTNINSLGNVNASGAASSEFLQYDGTNWVNVTAAGAGLLGTQGVTGSQGPQGVQGNQGFGLQGTVGPQGVGGIQGVQGLQGLQGSGSQGTQGTTGEASTVSGPVGSQGTQGVQGLQGVQGVQGIQGTLGTQGIVGEKGGFGGASFDYQFNTVTAGAPADPGFSYVSLNSASQNGSTIMSINDFGVTGIDISTFLVTIQSSTSIPKGHVRITSSVDANEFILWQITSADDQGGWWDLDVVPVASTDISPFTLDEDVTVSFVVTGDQGAQGTTGAGSQGTQGLQGTLGLQGLQGSGLQGTVGSQGPRGLDGPQGVQGLQGLLGTQGTQGIDGTGSQGTQGTLGTQGLQGTDGLQGLQGTDGTGSQGTTGLQGTGGIQGVQGNDGVGTQGTLGTQGLQGTDGLQGLQGTDGLGTQGTQGLLGLQGTDGLQGLQGTDGLGTQGTQGLLGLQGVQGSFEAGTQGAVGTTGTGLQGTTGLQGLTGGGSSYEIPMVESSFQASRFTLPLVSNGWLVGPEDQGWNASLWSSNVNTTSATGAAVPNTALSCAIPLTQNLTVAGNDGIRISLTVRSDYFSGAGTELHVRLFKWTCGTFSGGSAMNIVPLTANVTITGINRASQFYWNCYNNLSPVISDFDASTDRLLIGFATNSSESNFYDPGCSVSYKLWGQFVSA